MFHSFRKVLRDGLTLLALIACGVVFSSTAEEPAQASVKDSKGRFVFGPGHYGERNFDKKHTLPVNVVYRGSNGPYTPVTVNSATSKSWKNWGKRDRIRQEFCRGQRYLPYYTPGRQRSSFAAVALFASDDDNCADQWHARFFDDVRHAQLFDEPSGHFVVAQFHHDDLRIFKGKHFVDRNLDESRRVALQTMNRGHGQNYAVQFSWGYNAKARDQYDDGSGRGIFNGFQSRVIGRVSLKEVQP